MTKVINYNIHRSLILVFMVILVFFYGCNDSSVKPIDEEDIRPQQDIEWPSLANSPWPMNHADPQSTGRSKFVGPTSVHSVLEIDCPYMEMGFAIGTNQSVYYASSYAPGEFFSVDYNGNQKWKFDTHARSSTTPIVTNDNNILFAAMYYVKCLSDNGDLLWEYKNDARIYIESMNIDKSGNIYFIDENAKLKVLNHNGEYRWELYDSRINFGANSAIVFSNDGNTLYLQGDDVSILAVDIINKQVVWTFGDILLETSPIVDSYGCIYILYADRYQPIPKILYSLNSDGSINWEYKFYDNFVSSSVTPTIDYNGNIYFGSDTLYSVNYKGKERWKVDLKDNETIFSPLICDADNNIYIGVH